MQSIAHGILNGLRGLRGELKRQAPLLFGLAALGAMFVLFGCDAENTAADDASVNGGNDALADWGTLVEVCESDAEDGITRPAHWTVASHCKGVAPDYDKLFDDTVVHRFDITIDATVYQQTMDNLSQLLSSRRPGASNDVDEEPMWVPVNVKFDGKTWDYVGMRYKGNSSLRSAWQQGQRKLAFRFNFDKFEDDHPELKNQRFYGFKKMTFSNGYKDDSLIRDKLAADIFRAGGVPAARGAFARIYVDYGNGSVYFGLYTMIEDPSDELLGTQFSDDSGNLYKPEGQGATWATFVQDSFTKATNEDDSDWSDIEAAFAALHSDSRRSDPVSWREDLEQVFDAEHFLRCIALNQALENWDSYGFMTHNYYVYADPSEAGRLTWMPWDLNESLLHVDRGARYTDSVLLDEIDTNWPLIRYLLDDTVYRQVYKDELQAATLGAFAVSDVEAKIEAYHALVAPYVVGADGEATPYTMLSSATDFERSVADLKEHIASRHAAIQDALLAD